MKRSIFLLLVLCYIGTTYAQVGIYRSSGYGAIKKEKKERPKRTYEWEQFILANYGYGLGANNDDQHSFGITYGRVKIVGWYVHMMLGTGFHYGYTYEANSNADINGVYPFYTGKKSQNRASITAGGIVRMVIPLYFYLGAGYGYKTTTSEINSGQWVLMGKHDYDYLSYGHCMHWDVGLQGNIKGFTLSAGYSVLTNYDSGAMHEVKIGIGYTFKVK